MSMRSAVILMPASREPFVRINLIGLKGPASFISMSLSVLWVGGGEAWLFGGMGAEVAKGLQAGFHSRRVLDCSGFIPLADSMGP